MILRRRRQSAAAFDADAHATMLRLRCHMARCRHAIYELRRFTLFYA